ncbi:transposase [Rhizobium beringeri]
MTLDNLKGSGGLRAVKVLPNGKRRFDPVEKDRLIDAAMKPGVSVARLALAHGVNANQLRNWVKLRRDRQAQGSLTAAAGWKRRPLFLWLQRRRLRGSPTCRPGHHRQECG